MNADMFGHDLDVTDSFGTPRRLPETPLEKATAALRDLLTEAKRCAPHGIPPSDPSWDYARDVLRDICPHPPERLHAGRARDEAGTDAPWVACCDCGALLAGGAADLSASLDSLETVGNSNA